MNPVPSTRRHAARTAVKLLALSAALAAGPAAAKNEALVAGIQFGEALGALPDDCVSGGAGPALGGYIQGTGLATVVGAFQLASVDCIQTSSPEGDPPFAFSSSSFTLTTANGDAIHATYSGTATPVSAQTPWLLALRGTVTFTGGTGRFAKVKGSGTLSGIEDISPLQSLQPARGYLTLTGQISVR
jgi:hypothetical protein